MRTLVLAVLVLAVAAAPKSPFPTQRATISKVDWTNALPASRTAYVTIHHHDGSSDADARLIGVKVWARNVRNTGTTRDIVVLVSADTPDEARSRLREEGVKVFEMPSVREFAELDDYEAAMLVGDAECENGLSKVNLWDPVLLPYDRVLYMEPDVLPMLNLDELFLCGRFCAVYTSWQYYTTSMLVVKPDVDMVKVVRSYLQEFAASVLERHAPRLGGFLPPAIRDCADETDVFLLEWLAPGLEAGSLFDPSKGQSDEPLQRLSAAYNINAMYWYEWFSWHLFTAQNFQDAIKAGRYDGTVPGYAIGWHSIKPWDWWPSVFFSYHWLWQNTRQLLAPETGPSAYFIFRLVSTCAILGTAAAAEYLLPLLLGADKDGSGSTSRSSSKDGGGEAAQHFFRDLQQAVLASFARLRLFVGSSVRQLVETYGADAVGLPLAIACVIASGWLVYACVPRHAPPRDAWFAFIGGHVALSFFFLRFIDICLGPARPGGGAVSRASSPLPSPSAAALLKIATRDDEDTDAEAGPESAPLVRSASSTSVSESLRGGRFARRPTNRLIWALVLEVVSYQCLQLRYDQFASKIVVFYTFIGVCVLAHASAYRHLLRTAVPVTDRKAINEKE